MKTKWMKAIGAGLVLAGWLGFAAGCGDDVETDTALAIDPAKSEITGQGTTVFMTVWDPDSAVYETIPSQRAKSGSQDSATTLTNGLSSQIMLPLEWSVSNPSLGRIYMCRGYSAVYESLGGRGQNIVVVTDAAGREGLAVVEQRYGTTNAAPAVADGT